MSIDTYADGRKYFQNYPRAIESLAENSGKSCPMTAVFWKVLSTCPRYAFRGIKEGDKCVHNGVNMGPVFKKKSIDEAEENR